MYDTEYTKSTKRLRLVEMECHLCLSIHDYKRRKFTGYLGHLVIAGVF